MTHSSSSTTLKRVLDQAPYRVLTETPHRVVLSRIQAMVAALVARHAPAPNSNVPLFGYCVRLHIRTADVCRIFARLLDGRETLHALDNAPADERRTPDWSTRAQSEHDSIRTDFECLYFLGSLALDTWAIVAAHVFRIPNTVKTNLEDFRQHRAQEDVGPLLHDILWLTTHVRFYRNHFIAHAKRPWIVNSSRGTDDYTFQLSCDSHFDPEKMKARVLDLSRRMRIKLVPPSPPRLLLSVLVDSMHLTQDRKVRRELQECHEQYGTVTPTFHEVGRRILEFLVAATELVTSRAAADLDAVWLKEPAG